MANIERAIKAALAKRWLEFSLKDETLYLGGTEYKTFRPQVDSPQVVSPPSRFAPSRFAPKTTEGKLNKLIYFPYRFTAWTCLKNAF
jgi:hypothetical protein